MNEGPTCLSYLSKVSQVVHAGGRSELGGSVSLSKISPARGAASRISYTIHQQADIFNSLIQPRKGVGKEEWKTIERAHQMIPGRQEGSQSHIMRNM